MPDATTETLANRYPWLVAVIGALVLAAAATGIVAGTLGPFVPSIIDVGLTAVQRNLLTAGNLFVMAFLLAAWSRGLERPDINAGEVEADG